MGSRFRGPQILLVDEGRGAVSDQDGNFEISNLSRGSMLWQRFCLVRENEVVVELVGGETTSITVKLVEGIGLNAVQVTAGEGAN